MNAKGNKRMWDEYYANFESRKIDLDGAKTDYEKLLFSLASERTRALEYCCGRGYESLLLAKRFGITPTLTDYSEAALKLAAELFEKNGAKCKTVKADVYLLPFPDGSFDLAYSRGSFANLKDGLGALRELSRVLADGGVLIVCAPNALRFENAIFNRRRGYYQRSYFTFELVALAKKNGLKVVKTFGYDSFYVLHLKNAGLSRALINAPLPEFLKLFVGVVAEKRV